MNVVKEDKTPDEGLKRIGLNQLNFPGRENLECDYHRLKRCKPKFTKKFRNGYTSLKKVHEKKRVNKKVTSVGL